MNLGVRNGRRRAAYSNQRLVENSHREAQADVPAPLLIPDEGAWPKLLVLRARDLITGRT